MENRFFEEINGFYFIGIGGVSMSGLAKFLLSLGKKIGGSDIIESEYTLELEKLGVKINFGTAKGSVAEYDAVVYTDAIAENDFHLCEARALNKNIISRGHLLKRVSEMFGEVIAISGCHGKTTCTAMLAHIFYKAGKKFAAHIGGRDNVFSNFYFCGYDYFITEACEYKKNFLLLEPDIAAVLNEGADHLECYGSRSNLIAAYNDFLKNAKNAVCLSGIAGGISFGFENADYSAVNITECGGKYSFDICEKAVKKGTVNLSVYGKHNILNALAAAAVARVAGLEFQPIITALSDFGGVERRFEDIGTVNGAKCIADYAHHPDEIAASIAAAEKITVGELIIIFQPHTYSRTKNLFEDFVKVLNGSKNLLVYKTYAAREYFDDSGSALTLSQSLKNSRYGDNIFDIEDFLLGVQASDTVLFLGAGDIYDIAKKVIFNMNDRR